MINLNLLIAATNKWPFSCIVCTKLLNISDKKAEISLFELFRQKNIGNPKMSETEFLEFVKIVSYVEYFCVLVQLLNDQAVSLYVWLN